MGGAFALLSAPRYAFSVASVNYGEVPADALQRLAGACPIVASYGARDRGLRGRAQRLENALQTLGIEHDVKEYPDAGQLHEPHQRRPRPRSLVKFIGLNYRHESAEDSWRRILDFFDAHLRA
jgi:carboxymethylenebutenolidase